MTTKDAYLSLQLAHVQRHLQSELVHTATVQATARQRARGTGESCEPEADGGGVLGVLYGEHHVHEDLEDDIREST